MKYFMYLAALLTFSSNISSQPGFDSTFGVNGIAVVPYYVPPDVNMIVQYGMAVQPDNKIVNVGAANVLPINKALVAVTRLKPNGSLDSSFDNDGIAFINAAEMGTNEMSFGIAVTIAPDGKIVIAGDHRRYEAGTLLSYSMVVRLNTDGSPDLTFSNNGIATFKLGPAGSYENLAGVAVQADHKVVVTGSYGAHSMTIARLTASGNLDHSFNGNGKVYINHPGYSFGKTVKVQGDGKIVASGTINTTNKNFVCVRLNADGTFDNTFDNDGIVTVDMSGKDDYGRDMTIGDDGKIVMVGYTEDVSGSLTTTVLSILNLNPDGSLNTAFDTDGKMELRSPAFTSGGQFIAIQSNRKIIIGATVNPTRFRGYLAIIRLNINGSFDTSFYGDGSFQSSIGDGQGASSMIMQRDGKIVSADFGILAPGKVGTRLVRVLNNESNDDNQDPEISFCPSVSPTCSNASNRYTIPSLAATDNSGSFAVSYYIDGATIRGTLQSPITGNNASGIFHPGTSIIHWKVRDKAGNQDTCTTAVKIGSAFTVSIPGVQVLPKGVSVNTVYTGYTPASLLSVKAVVGEGGGSSVFSYKWSTTGGLNIQQGTENKQTAQVSASRPGNYHAILQVVVTDGKGCSVEKQVAIRVIDVRCGDKILVCKPQTGNTLCISANAVAAHLNNAGSSLGGCSNNAPTTMNRSKLEEVPALRNNPSIAIYPNPSSDRFVVKMEKWEAAYERALIMITDVNGRIMERKTISAELSSIQFGEAYAPGFYVVEVIQRGRSTRMKVVKMK